MSASFLLYGSTGFVGDAMARLALQQGLKPILAGRNAAKVQAQSSELRTECRVFELNDSAALDKALKEVAVVLHCAGPYIHTSRQMAEGCLRTGTHYLDITGEIPVYAALAARDAEAKARGVMLLPGVGFDVVPTDCLALYLKQRLPSATRLTLAFHSQGPAALPPGTANTLTEMVPYGERTRQNGRLKAPPRGMGMRMIDFGQGPLPSMRLTWGDIFMAYISTGIPNIEDYAALPERTRRQLASLAYVRPLFRLGAVRRLAKRMIKTGSTAEERARTHTTVWGEVKDNRGNRAVARMHGPEAGVVWTSLAALAAVRRVLAGVCPPGFQTPATAYGADFTLECEGVTREDVN